MSNSLCHHGLQYMSFPVLHYLLELAQTHVHSSIYFWVQTKRTKSRVLGVSQWTSGQDFGLSLQRPGFNPWSKNWDPRSSTEWSKKKAEAQRDICVLLLAATLLTINTIANTEKQPEYPSVDIWIKNMWYIYAMEYYSTIKKSEIMPLVAIWWTQKLLY